MAKLGDIDAKKLNRLEHWRGRKGKESKKQDIELEEVYRLARCMLPQPDIAVKLGITRNTLTNWLNDWPEFADTLQRGYSDTRQELANTQLELALSGHASMLMWLGKQYLGQSDKQIVENNTQINVTVQRAVDALRNIPKEQLLASRDALRTYTPQDSALQIEHSSGENEGGDPPV